MVVYRKGRTIVRKLTIVSNEQLIKMITDLKESTAAVDKQEYLIQVVEDYRRKIELSKKSGLCTYTYFVHFWCYNQYTGTFDIRRVH
jgi:hypothetical protein